MNHAHASTFPDEFERSMQRIALLARATSDSIPAERKLKYSQYFTEGNVARQMASMIKLPAGAVIGDHGSGTGILAATVLLTTLRSSDGAPAPCVLRAYEIDELLHDAFCSTMSEVAGYARASARPSPRYTLGTDFTLLADDIARGGHVGTLDAVVLNPPYKKLAQSSDLARTMKRQFVGSPNLYVVFIVLSILMLRDGGQLVAIIPRSFTNGDYFRPFRKWLRVHGSIDWIVRYRRRSNVFRGDNVLQENVILKFTKGASQASRIRVSLCDSPDSPPVHDILIPAADMFPAGAGTNNPFLIPADPEELSALHRLRNQPFSMEDLGIKVCTGKLEDFRVRNLLHSDVTRLNWAPVIYSQHWGSGLSQIEWASLTANNKLACVTVTADTEKKLVPRGNYVLIKRISANDDRAGRCHTCVLTAASEIPGDLWAIDNHIQVISGDCLTPVLANELAAYLASADVNAVLRVLSGTTQINCSDLESLRFPLFAQQ